MAKCYGRGDFMFFARNQNKPQQKIFHSGRRIFFILFFAALKILIYFHEDKRPQHLAAARNMGWSGKVGHNSSRGKPFEERMRDFHNGCGENCSYGFREPLDIIFQLILDESVPSLGHRKNILDRIYTITGTSIQAHTKYGTCCVIDFAAQSAEPTAAKTSPNKKKKKKNRLF